MLAMTFEAVRDVITTRRTNMRVDRERMIEPSLVEELCRLATWAPNHKMTEPWRFIAVTGDARHQLGEAAAHHQARLGETDENRLNKTRGKYARTPLCLVVASAHHEDPSRRQEDRDAVSAGVQNLLLAATAAGLATYWGTGVVCDSPEVKQLCGLGPHDEIVGVLYMGWPLDATTPIPPRSAPQLSWRS
jgi:nitroreductase